MGKSIITIELVIVLISVELTDLRYRNQAGEMNVKFESTGN